MTSIKIFVLSLFSALFLCHVLNVKSFRLYSWTQTGEMFCKGNATKKQTEALMKCDKLMRPEVMNVLILKFWRLFEKMPFALNNN